MLVLNYIFLKKYKSIFLLLIVLIPGFAEAQNSITPKLEAYVKNYSEVHDFSGVVLVAIKGKIVYQKAIGQANREWNVSNTLDTRFRIASLTKQFTAAAILQLAEKGKLTLEDNLSRYFPGFPKGDSVTIHMLLNHTSGISEYSQNPDLFKLNPNQPLKDIKDTVLNTFRNLPFDFSPGTWWRYSNSNYMLLGWIIEQVSGTTYESYLSKNIFLKADMNNSGLIRQDSIIPRRAYGYNKIPGSWVTESIIPLNTAFSAGGLFSTAGDLNKWQQALFSGKIISKDWLSKMTKPNREPVGAGYGIFVEEIYNRRAYSHSGNTPGFSSYMNYYPKEEVQIILLANRETNTDFLPKSLAAICFGKPVDLPKKRKPMQPGTIVQNYSGEYVGDSLPFPLNIVERDNKLYLNLGRDIELFQESPNKFYINDPDVEMQIEFVPNGKNPPEEVVYIEAGIRMKAKRK